MRSFGKGFEEFYNRIKQEGTKFIRAQPSHVTQENGNLIIHYEDRGLPQQQSVDMIILSVALEAQPDAESVARLFNISRSADGFFLERHPKLDPVTTMTDGIYVAGCCQSPKDIPDTVAQASATAAEVLALIGKGIVDIEAVTANINQRVCNGCLLCLHICPYSAISFNDEQNVCYVNEALCKGCGTCASGCPSHAINLSHYTNEQILAEMEGLLIS
jgi:heterodisulfide reductase subunit A